MGCMPEEMYVDLNKLRECKDAMTHFLAKTDPGTYSIEQLEQDET